MLSFLNVKYFVLKINVINDLLNLPAVRHVLLVWLFLLGSSFISVSCSYGDLFYLIKLSRLRGLPIQNLHYKVSDFLHHITQHL